MNTRYKKTDRSKWPVITQNEYAAMLTTITAGLLASGHYTQVDAENGPALLHHRTERGYYEPIVMTPAEKVAQEILDTCDLRSPECKGGWEEDDERETLNADAQENEI
jgi:hypothetical protein